MKPTKSSRPAKTDWQMPEKRSDRFINLVDLIKPIGSFEVPLQVWSNGDEGRKAYEAVADAFNRMLDAIRNAFEKIQCLNVTPSYTCDKDENGNRIGPFRDASAPVTEQEIKSFERLRRELRDKLAEDFSDDTRGLNVVYRLIDEKPVAQILYSALTDPDCRHYLKVPGVVLDTSADLPIAVPFYDLQFPEVLIGLESTQSNGRNSPNELWTEFPEWKLNDVSFAVVLKKDKTSLDSHARDST